MDKSHYFKINRIDTDNVQIITEDISERRILQLVDNNWNVEMINVFLYRTQECFDKDITDKSSGAVIQSLWTAYSTIHEKLRIISTNDATEFTSREFAEMMTKLKIQHIFTPILELVP